MQGESVFCRVGAQAKSRAQVMLRERPVFIGDSIDCWREGKSTKNGVVRVGRDFTPVGD
jgi:hypothetical protein